MVVDGHYKPFSVHLSCGVVISAKNGWLGWFSSVVGPWMKGTLNFSWQNLQRILPDTAVSVF
jgi:hypothetical protein